MRKIIGCGFLYVIKVLSERVKKTTPLFPLLKDKR